jgi:hypothetical protein
VTSLPWFRDEDIGPAVDTAEAVMKQHGLERREAPARPYKVYDLEPEMIFTLSDDEKVALGELERDYEGYVLYAAHNGGSGKITGYADLWDPKTGSSKHSNTRVIVTIGGEGLCLFDTKYEVRHRWKHCEPRPDTLGEQLKALMAQMQAVRS